MTPSRALNFGRYLPYRIPSHSPQPAYKRIVIEAMSNKGQSLACGFVGLVGLFPSIEQIIARIEYFSILMSNIRICGVTLSLLSIYKIHSAAGNQRHPKSESERENSRRGLRCKNKGG